MDALGKAASWALLKLLVRWPRANGNLYMSEVCVWGGVGASGMTKWISWALTGGLQCQKGAGRGEVGLGQVTLGRDTPAPHPSTLSPDPQ